MISRPVTSFASAAVLTGTATAALRAAAPGGRARWERRNHAGRSVGLYSGPAATLAAAAGAVRLHPAAALAVLAAGACGAYDDIAGAGDPRRGFRAHLGALRRGEVTSGAVKLFGVSAAGAVAGAVLGRRPWDKALAGVVIAGTAHAVNLVDVRPGRAAGLVLALAAPGLLRGGPDARAAAAVAGAAAAVLPGDLAERTMLGDTGAHALGAALGAAAVAREGRRGLLAHTAAVLAAAACGERVSALARAPWTRGGRPARRLTSCDSVRGAVPHFHSCE
ncbi:hypothetical protein [Streptomyces sp. NPDC004065]|uniref:hypothetical protein n=1 Tax=Streptomyces sp. NPDC004065 TaxID=3364689 RepID=UPI00384AF795